LIQLNNCTLHAIQLYFKKKLNAYSLFLFIFLFHLIFIFQGLDLTDFGYHCTNQISAVTFPIHSDAFQQFYFFTDFIGGIWLSIPGSPNVVWARLGGILLISMISVIVYSILCNYFRKDIVFVVVFSSSVFVTMHTFFNIINYNLFPAFLVIVEIFLIDKLMNCKDDLIKSKIIAFFIGFMTVPIIFSRFPLLLLLIIPITIIGYFLVIKEKIQRYGLWLYFMGLGLLLSLFLFICFYSYIGILTNYMQIMPSIFNDSLSGTSTIIQGHSVYGLFSLYLSEYQKVFFDMIYVALFFGIFYSLFRLKKKDILKPFGDCIIFIYIVISLLILLFLGVSTNDTNSFSLEILKDIVGVLIILSCYFIWHYGSKNKKITILLIMGLMTMLVIPLGSNTGLSNSVMGMWLILPLCILCSYRWVNEMCPCDKKLLHSMIAAILISMVIIAIFFHTSYTYRDNPNKLNLNTGFTYPALKGIYSTSDRVTVVEETLAQINNNTKPGDEILIVNSVPLFYYLTQTRPALGNPWLEPQVPLNKIKRDQETLENANRYPKLFVFCKINPRDPNWPNTKDIAWKTDLPKLNYLKTRYVSELNYSLIWENRAFEIYTRPDVI
jgi:hypothetical protein